MLISYTSLDEAIFTTADAEKAMLDEYFFEESGRNLEDYDREVLKTGIGSVTARLFV